MDNKTIKYSVQHRIYIWVLFRWSSSTDNKLTTMSVKDLIEEQKNERELEDELQRIFGMNFRREQKSCMEFIK